MADFYEEFEIVFTAKVVRLKDSKTNWVSELYGQLDYMLRSDKHMLVGISDLEVKENANEHTKKD
jgi:hypothetical protein